jgi:hypothetical protein
MILALPAGHNGQIGILVLVPNGKSRCGTVPAASLLSVQRREASRRKCLHVGSSTPAEHADLEQWARSGKAIWYQWVHTRLLATDTGARGREIA